MDPLALWGAVTGTAGVGISLRREYLVGRRDLAVAPGINFSTSRVEPVGAITHGWACVAFWNTGGRSLAVERAGFQYLAIEKGTDKLLTRRAMIYMETPREAAVDGPTFKLYTPLGPMLAAGISLFGEVEALAITTGGREWMSPPQPLLQSMPPMVTHDLLKTGLERLRDDGEAPPLIGREIGLKEETPFLVDIPPSR